MKSYSLEHFKHEEEKNFIQNRFDSISRNQEHDMVVNSILNMFQTGNIFRSKFGFGITTLEPLFNLKDFLNHTQKKNPDIMVHNHQRKETMFIEVKSSMEMRSIGRELKNFEQARDTIINNFSEIKSLINLDKEEHESIEFILAVPKEQSADIIKRIEDNGIQDIILWTHSPLTKPMIVDHTVTNLSGMIESNRTHKNKEMRDELHKGISLTKEKLISFMLTSDPFIKINTFLPLIHKYNKTEFNFIDVENIFEFGGLLNFYNEPQDCKKYIYQEFVLNLEKLGLIKRVKNEENIFDARFELKIRRDLSEFTVKKELKEKFIEFIKKDKQKDIELSAIEKYKEYNSQADLNSYKDSTEEEI